MITDFTAVTELPGSRATRDQIARLHHRYRLAAGYAAGRRVLEVACGSGQGLGYFTRRARSVVAGDYTANLLRMAHAHYGPRVRLVQLDGQRLPFESGSFDLVVMFEAMYYLEDASRFVDESRRVLAPGGALIVGTVNKDWSEFAPSPHSTKYWSAPELYQLLAERYARVELSGAFPTAARSLKQRAVSFVRQAVVGLHLMPTTLEGRERFKRLAYGTLEPLGPELEEIEAPHEGVVSLAGDRLCTEYKILYAVAR